MGKVFCEQSHLLWIGFIFFSLLVVVVNTFFFWIVGLIAGLFTNLFLFMMRGFDRTYEELENPKESAPVVQQ